MTYQSLTAITQIPEFDEIIVIDDPVTATIELNGRGRSVTFDFEDEVELENSYLLDEFNCLDIVIPKNVELQMLNLVLEEGEIKKDEVSNHLSQLGWGLDRIWRWSGYSRMAIFDDGLEELAAVSMERWIRDGVVIATDSGWTLTKIGRALKALVFGVRKKGGNGFFVSVHVS